MSGCGVVVVSVGGVRDLLLWCHHWGDEHGGQQWQVLCVLDTAGLGQDLCLRPRQGLTGLTGLSSLIEPRPAK